MPQSEWFSLTDQDVRDVIQKVTSIANIEFLMPEFVQSFVGPQYRIIKVPPYMRDEYESWRMFGMLVVAFVVGYLIANYG